MKLILITVLSTAMVLGGAVAAEAKTPPRTGPKSGFNISIALPYCPPVPK